MTRKTIFSLIAVFILTIGIAGMAISDLGKVCLFSEISGVITLDGKPVANAKLVRIVNRNKKLKDETVTDANGYFKFPAVYERTVTKLLPQEFAVNQKIMLHFQGKEIQLWEGVKRKPHENSESRGKPLEVKCEINGEEHYKRVEGSMFLTFCTWEAEPDIVNTGF